MNGVTKVPTSYLLWCFLNPSKTSQRLDGSSSNASLTQLDYDEAKCDYIDCMTKSDVMNRKLSTSNSKENEAKTQTFLGLRAIDFYE